ncbi:MAG: M1 family metallopeptidase [Zavarzinella sp.]|nr:M1 family metallopeptidase [Zavarzinella sp.]
MSVRVPSALAAALVAIPLAAAERDTHSFATPEHVRVRHIDLDLEVDFDARVIRGTATLRVERTSKDTKKPLVLDTRGLTIESVEASTDGKAFAKTAFGLGKIDPILGQPLTVQVPEAGQAVRVKYATGPKAGALQWLSPKQTAGKKYPLLFTQSEAIEARSWVPLQDTPGVRITYTAHVRTPKDLLAVMSAANDPEQKRTGDYHFEMKQPIPSYLMALCVGDLEFRRIGARTGVYAEPPVVDRAAREFADLEEFLKACENLYGPYRWGRYDVLVMPPSFPFGGMENPRLTFASPTTIAGDKSLVSVLAHELAHSWSGNLVSNATWRDFWLNEGFTVYLERRILEAVYGKARADAEAVLGRRSLDRELAELPKPDQVLHIDLTGRPPDDGLSDVPYEKGSLFLRHLEAVYGRERFDEFLKGYFAHFSFQSITTAQFAAYLGEHLLKGDPEKAAKANVREWLYQAGLPADAPNPQAATLTKVEEQAKAFAAGSVKAADLPGKTWTAHQWIHFLTALPGDVGRDKLAALDAAFAVTRSGNSEVLFQWLLLAVRNGYEPAYGRLEDFLTGQGRMKFLKPLYAELTKTAPGKERALAIYRKARPTYHPASVEAVDAIVGWKDGK